jgi:hypothetical protein
MKKQLGLAALGFLLSAFVVMAAVPARADSVDDKISALEQELNRLKAEQAQARAEQIELKREATVAAAAVPIFGYRPGRGFTITAADGSWSFNTTYELMTVIYNHTDGNDRRGATVGDLHNRRNRPYWIFCVNRCFYHWVIGLDIDTATNFGNGIEQSQQFRVGFDRINPFLPELHVGDALSGPYGGAPSATPAGDRSSTSSPILESAFDLVSDSAAHMLSRRAISLFWNDIPLGMGDSSFALEYKMPANFQDTSTASSKRADTDRAGFQTSIQLRPFVKTKGFWTRGIRFGTSFQTVSIDRRSTMGARMRLNSGFERVGAQTLLDTGGAAGTVGDGTHWAFSPGFDWDIGPYKLGWQGRWSRYEGREDRFRGLHGSYWRIWHELFLWSPKGWFTGSGSTFGSVQAGFGFTRAQVDCGVGVDCAPGSGSFNSAHLINREVGLYYYIRSGMRIGINAYFWTSSNTPVGVQQAIGCKKRPTSSDVGKECDWTSVNLILNANW